MLVTGNRKVTFGLKRESVLIVPECARSEPFSTFTAATLLVGF
jgi:hypothetical protein